MSGLETLTVVMPVFNEEDSIAEALDEVRRFVLDVLPGSDCVAIDDGSTDATLQILGGITAADSRIAVIRQANAGHGAALRAGMERARGDWLFLLDSDRQMPLEAFGSLWAAVANRDAAFGVRAERHDPMARLILSRLIAVTLRAIFGVSLRDANVPFKVIRRSVWVEARDMIPAGTLAPSLFLAVFAEVRRLHVVECDVPHMPRRSGVGSLRPLRLIRFCTRGFAQLVAFRIRLGSLRPKSPTTP